MPAKPIDNDDNESRPTRILVYAVFFLSGTAALIYEISWSRQLGLLFGHTVHAASVVLASYFAGMAAGYLLGAKWPKRISPLIGYAVAELVVAAWAIVIPILIEASESQAIAPMLTSSSFSWQTIIRAMFSFFLLLPGTIALGATLPLIADFLSGDGDLSDSKISARISLAYAINTAGALVGVLSATFYLLVVVGVCGSSYLAALLSFLCAVAALAVSRTQKSSPREKMIATDSNRDCGSPDEENSEFSLLIGLSCLSGFGILALQILYTRMFALVFHNSTYTFGIVVAVFLASLAIGATLAARLQIAFHARTLIGLAMGIGALLIGGSVMVFVWMTKLSYFSFGASFAEYILGALGLVSIVVGPPIICLGLVLPLVWKLAGHSAGVGQVVGRLTAVNTLSAATGAMISSFVLLRWVGLWESFVLLSVLFFIASFLLIWPTKQKWTVGTIGLLLGCVSVFAIQSPTEAETNRTELGERVIKRWNSAYGWIDVIQRESTGQFKVRQNLHYRFGKTGSNVREFRQAHLPLLLHPKPKDVLFLGLGTGLTAAGAIPHSEVEHIVAVELIPEVVLAAKEIGKHNWNVADNPKVEIRIDDARHFLLADTRQFDLIVSDLFVPWESESGYLYTVEHYQIAASRLNDGGLFCQWLPLYQVGEREFSSIANSFSKVFPNSTLWWGETSSRSPVVALIGSNSKIRVSQSELESRLSKLRARGSDDPTIATPGLIWDHYIGDWNLQSEAEFNTDEHPSVEFLTPISNRNNTLIGGSTLESFFDRVLDPLPKGSNAIIDNEQIQSDDQRINRQRRMLFGY